MTDTVSTTPCYPSACEVLKSSLRTSVYVYSYAFARLTFTLLWALLHVIDYFC